MLKLGFCFEMTVFFRMILIQHRHRIAIIRSGKIYSFCLKLIFCFPFISNWSLEVIKPRWNMRILTKKWSAQIHRTWRGEISTESKSSDKKTIGNEAFPKKIYTYKQIYTTRKTKNSKRHISKLNSTIQETLFRA